LSKSVNRLMSLGIDSQSQDFPRRVATHISTRRTDVLIAALSLLHSRDGGLIAMSHPNAHLPLVIEVRGNEFASTADNPHVPVGAEAIIGDAVDCAAAGAAGYHWHARGTDGIDRPDDVELHSTVTRGLRDTGLILHPTLGFTSTQGDTASRLRTVLALNADPTTRVDIVPADIGAFILDGWDSKAARFVSDDNVLLNTTGYLIALLTALRRENVRVLAVVWSPGAVRSALRFREGGILPAPTFWQLGFTGSATPGGPPPTPGMGSAFVSRSRLVNTGRSTYATDRALRWPSGLSLTAATSASGSATIRTPTWVSRPTPTSSGLWLISPISTADQLPIPLRPATSCISPDKPRPTGRPPTISAGP
jgi:hypothetical protein